MTPEKDISKFMNRSVVFVFNLLQDVNVLRPLVYLAAREIGLPCMLLVTHLFRQRDSSGLWQQELLELAQDNWARIVDFDDLPSGLHALDGMAGYLIAGSESDLSAHKPVHDLFRAAPPGLRKITLQHGFECVGFLQSRDQNLAHGTGIGFAAEIVCGWAAPERLHSVAPTQRHKLFVTGPSFLLHPPVAKVPSSLSRAGLVCENMHSPRLNVAGNFKQDFFEVFTAFCGALNQTGETVTLRPHPGGQYVLKQGLALPSNVRLSNLPIYRTDISQYAYGISAPSSVLLDMVLAGIPTAVWQDDSSLMDLGNYDGLARIRNLADWLEFKESAIAKPAHYFQQQERFLERQMLVTDRRQIAKNFRSLLHRAQSATSNESARAEVGHRILVIANANVPTLQLSFLKPLQQEIAQGTCAVELLTEEQIAEALAQSASAEQLSRMVTAFGPTSIVFCRYSGPGARDLLEIAETLDVPTVFQIDDDLLSIPTDLGARKHAFHTAPARVGTVRELLQQVSVIYCSTQALALRLRDLGIKNPIFEAKIYCSGQILRPAKPGATVRIGYMASADHAHNLTTLIPALFATMRKHPQVNFEFFGTIPSPVEFKEFGDRITHAPKVDNYSDFLHKFAEREWDVGICPLSPIPFNLMKANTKWVEYTSAGAAVIASRGTVYDTSCAEECGLLAGTPEEWSAALEVLINDEDYRHRMVRNAQAKLEREYSVKELKNQVFEVLTYAKNLHGAKRAL